MATISKERVSYRKVSGFTTAAPVAGDTWTLFPQVDGPFDDKDNMSFDEGKESNNVGVATPDIPTVPDGSGGGTVRVYGGTKAFDGAGGDTDPTDTYLKELIDNFMGGVPTTLTGTTIAAPGTAAGRTAPIVVTSAAGMAVGMGLLIGAVGGSAAEIRFIEGISGTNITLDQDLSAANRVTGSVIYGAFNWSPELNTYSEYIAFNVERDGNSRMYWPSRVTEMDLAKVAAKDGVRMRFGFLSDNWTDGVTPSATPTDSFRANTALIGVGSPFSWNRSTVVVTEFNCKLGIKHEEQQASSGDRGRQGFESTEFMGEGSFTEYFLNSRFTSDYKSATAGPLRLAVLAQGLNTAKARASFGLWIPNANIRVSRAAVDGKRAAKVDFKMKVPTAAQVAAGITKPFYYSQFGGV